MLDVVTRDPLPSETGITVHHGLAPNSPELIDLYWNADVFCLPTLADSLALVLAEAGIAGLPLVSTDVGAISELVRPEQTGLLVPPGDDVALGRRARSPGLGSSTPTCARRKRSACGARRVHAATNVSRLVDLLVDTAGRR